jgi:hypothetical protein
MVIVSLQVMTPLLRGGKNAWATDRMEPVVGAAIARSDRLSSSL